MRIIEYGALTESYGGVEAYIKNQVEELYHTDIDMDFLVPNENNKLAYESYLENKGCRIYRGYRRWHQSCFGHYIDLYKFFSNHRDDYDVAIANYLDYQNINFLIVAKLFGLKTVAHAHSAGAFRNWKRKVLVKLNRLLSKYFVDDLFACSNEAATWMFGSDLIEEKNVTIVKNKIDARKFLYDCEARKEIRRKNNIGEAAVVIGNTGRLSPGKNHNFMIDIFYNFKKICPDSYLMFIGDGILMNSLKSKTKELGLTDSVLLVGKQNNVGAWLSAMDIFLFSSDHEGLPLALIEAQTSGLKCILSDKVPSEAVISDLCKIVPLENDAKYWCKCILENINYERKSNINSAVENGYDMSSSREELVGIYHELLR